jgi:HAD superfamily hydrolase (TIGR01509 family)
MTAGIRGVVFDLDGTVLNTWDVHIYCLRAACAAVGAPRPTMARLVRAQRATDTATIAALVGDGLAVPAEDAYQTALGARLASSPPAPMPEVPETLQRLGEAGVRLGVCTGRSRREAAALIRESGLPIDLLIAREDTTRPKPAPDGLLAAVALLGLRTGEAIFVGDGPDDARQGTAAGIRTVLVAASAGWQPGVEVVDGMAQVLKWLN